MSVRLVTIGTIVITVPFFTAPIRGACALDANFLSDCVHLCHGLRHANLGHPDLVLSCVPPVEWDCLPSPHEDFADGQARDPVIHHHGRALDQPLLLRLASPGSTSRVG
jgi:hypothetical protein